LALLHFATSRAAVSGVLVERVGHRPGRSRPGWRVVHVGEVVVGRRRTAPSGRARAGGCPPARPCPGAGSLTGPSRGPRSPSPAPGPRGTPTRLTAGDEHLLPTEHRGDTSTPPGWCREQVRAIWHDRCARFQRTRGGIDEDSSAPVGSGARWRWWWSGRGRRRLRGGGDSGGRRSRRGGGHRTERGLRVALDLTP